MIVNILLINHRIAVIEAATWTYLDEIIFDQFADDYDKIVTLATTVIRAQNPVRSSIMDISLDMSLIYPLY